MARGSSWEFGSTDSTSQCPFPVWRTGQIASLPVQSSVRFHLSFLLLASVGVATLLTTFGFAQDDIHVVPRETKKANASIPPPPTVDPSVR